MGGWQVLGARYGCAAAGGFRVRAQSSCRLCDPRRMPLVRAGVLRGVRTVPGGDHRARHFALAELVAPRKTLGRQPPRIRAVAAPIGKLLERHREFAPRAVEPLEPVRALEGLHVREPAVLVALQAHTRAARHLGQLLHREDQHLAVLANGGDLLALKHAYRARFVGRLHVEHLLALARGAEALVLGNNEASPLMARDYELPSALERKHRD